MLRYNGISCWTSDRETRWSIRSEVHCSGIIYTVCSSIQHKISKSTFSDRGFMTAGPKLWNDLRNSIKRSMSLDVFRNILRHIILVNFILYFKGNRWLECINFYVFQCGSRVFYHVLVFFLYPSRFTFYVHSCNQIKVLRLIFLWLYFLCCSHCLLHVYLCKLAQLCLLLYCATSLNK